MNSNSGYSSANHPTESLVEDARQLRRFMLAFTASPQEPIRLETVLLAFTSARRIARQVRERTTFAASNGDGKRALEDWLAFLPKLQGWLLAERARLESRRTHAASVQRWVDSSHRTR